VHRESMSVVVQQDVTVYSLLRFCKLLNMFWVVTPPIIRSTYNCNYSIWHWSNFRKCSVWSQLKMRGMDPSLLNGWLSVVEFSANGMGRIYFAIVRYMCKRWQHICMETVLPSPNSTFG